MRATTILAVRLGGDLVLIGDGQATANDFVVKPNVRKLRRLGPVAPTKAADAAAATTSPATRRLSETAASASPVVAGFAGLAADGLALLDRLDAQVRAHPGQLKRAAVELAKAWRQDRALRELDAAVLVADADTTLWLAGNGDVLESADGVVAVGSGSDFAEAAARALIDAAAMPPPPSCPSPPHRPNLTALDVARRAMRVAADSCVYTNHRWTWCRLRRVEGEAGAGAGAGGGAGAAGGKAQGAPAASVVVDEGSEDGLLTTAGPPEPTHGGDVV
jgi:ATP-dependent HslUV protease subunit HslV